jgi:hypothetical protein
LAGSKAHARVVDVTRAKGDTVHVSVDLTFIDVTSVIRAQTTHLETYERKHDILGEDVAFEEGGEFDPDDIHHGCELHVYELTATSGPKAWGE